MVTPLRPNPFFDALADEHRRWLSVFAPQYLANWEKILNADQGERKVRATKSR